MYMGTGLLMMGAGVIVFAVDAIIVIVRLVTGPKKRKKLEAYLSERY